MSFSFEKEKNGTMSVLDVEISREIGKFVTTAYRKTSGVYTHFESFLLSTHKFDVHYTLVYRCFLLCSDQTKFHRELVTLQEIFHGNGYPQSLIDKYFKKILDRLNIIKPNLETVKKKPLRLVLPYLEPISLQVKTKISNAMKTTLNCCFQKLSLKAKENFLIC